MTVFNTPPFGIRFIGEHNLFGGPLTLGDSHSLSLQRTSGRLALP